MTVPSSDSVPGTADSVRATAHSVPGAADTLRTVVIGRKRRRRRRTVVIASLSAAIVVFCATSLMIGTSFVPPGDVLAVLAGQAVPGASFTIGELRLPRAALAVLSGFAFGLAGVTFQTMLRNPLASPDIIGITSGASAAAVFGIVILALDATAVSLLALAGALLTALAIHRLSNGGGFSGTRLILIGIGVAAMLDSAVTYLLSRAAAWDLQSAMRWLSGSLNGASWPVVLPLAVAVAVFVPILLTQGRSLSVLRLGDDSAAALGVRVRATRGAAIIAAVVLLAFATAATGPIAFVAFMAGPIAARLVGPGGSLLVPSGLVGGLLVLTADLLGRFAFDARYPVGVITGVIGAPFLVYLLIRTNRSGGSL